MKVLIADKAKKDDFFALARKVRREKVSLDDMRKFGTANMRENYARLVLAMDRYGKNEVARALEEQGRMQGEPGLKKLAFNIFNRHNEGEEK